MLYLPFPAPPLLTPLCRSMAKRTSRGKLAAVPSLMGNIEGLYFLRRGLFLPAELPALMGMEMAREGLERLGFPLPEMARAHARDHVAAIGLLESTQYLRNQLLRNSDWASMGHSLELRTPFVDLKLLESLGPCASSFRGGIGKLLLGQSPKAPLSAAIRSRPKTGFTVPLARWMSEVSGSGARSRSPAEVRRDAVGQAMGTYRCSCRYSRRLWRGAPTTATRVPSVSVTGDHIGAASKSCRCVSTAVSETQPVKVIHTVDGLALNRGGPSITVPALCDHLQRQQPDWNVTIVTHIRKREASHRITPVVFVIEAPPGRYLAALQRSKSRRAALSDPARQRTMAAHQSCLRSLCTSAHSAAYRQSKRHAESMGQESS